MKSIEVIQDIELEQIKHFNQWLSESSIVVENNNDQLELVEYLKNISKPAVLHKDYCILSVLWSPVHKYMNLSSSKEILTLVEIATDHLLFKTVDGNIKRYPEEVNNTASKNHATVLFDSENDRTGQMLFLKLTFSDWKITEKQS